MAIKWGRAIRVPPGLWGKAGRDSDGNWHIMLAERKADVVNADDDSGIEHFVKRGGKWWRYSDNVSMESTHSQLEGLLRQLTAAWEP
jgi:hypothetical protein